MFYSTASEYVWYESNGRLQAIVQAEGGEQGNPLMPALFALGQHAALAAKQVTVRPGEHCFAFLDDVYAVCEPDTAKELFDEVGCNL